MASAMRAESRSAAGPGLPLSISIDRPEGATTSVGAAALDVELRRCEGCQAFPGWADQRDRRGEHERQSTFMRRMLLDVSGFRTIRIRRASPYADPRDAVSWPLFHFFSAASRAIDLDSRRAASRRAARRDSR